MRKERAYDLVPDHSLSDFVSPHGKEGSEYWSASLPGQWGDSNVIMCVTVL